ncbi:PAS domain S-box protein [Fodinicurvata sp. EGI_FJ10296]|uniref:sensor histidine kinase n=1 Tax=Fodinicurvata sp. EGI_FJ10296 TaxID=3231908 RepID=UPI003452023B
MAELGEIPDLVLMIVEGLDKALICRSIVVLSHPKNKMDHWIGDRDVALRVCQRIDADFLIRDSRGTIETVEPIDAAMGDVRYIAAYPVISPLGPESFVVAVAGTDGMQRDSAWALLRALALEVTSELMIQVNAPSIHAVLDDAPVGVSIVSMMAADAPLIYVNRGFERMTGYSRAEVTGRNCRFLQGNFENEPQRRVIREAQAVGQACTVELQNVRKDGREFTNLLKLRPVYNAGDAKPSFYIGFQTDISAQRQAERAREAIIDAAPIAMLVVDVNGVIQRVNAQLETLFGYAGETLIGRSVEMLIPANLHSRHQELREAFQRSPSKRQMGPDRAVRALRHNGTEFPVEIGLSYYTDEDQAYVIAAINDISQRKALEDNLREKKEEAELANQAQAAFFANVSHELRTPLNAIIGFSDILKTNTAIGEKEREYLKDINESAWHLFEVIDHILHSAKLSAGKWKINPHRLNVAQIVRYAIRQIELYAQKKRLALQVAIQPDMPDLWADERSLRQVLTNLITNATKYTPADGRIDVAARLGSNAKICIEIADTGPGMDRNEKRRALEPFGSAEDSYTRREGGIGLGLPIANALVHLHQGRLEIDTEKGRGTIVRIIMPADRTCANPSPKNALGFKDMPTTNAER